jgi:hypothetical protein
MHPKPQNSGDEKRALKMINRTAGAGIFVRPPQSPRRYILKSYRVNQLIPPRLTLKKFRSALEKVPCAAPEQKLLHFDGPGSQSMRNVMPTVWHRMCVWFRARRETSFEAKLMSPEDDRLSSDKP